MLAVGAKDEPRQLRAAQRLLSAYRQLLRRTGIEPRALQECERKTSGVLRELAVTWHREAQRTKNDAMIETQGVIV